MLFIIRISANDRLSMSSRLLWIWGFSFLSFMNKEITCCYIVLCLFSSIIVLKKFVNIIGWCWRCFYFLILLFLYLRYFCKNTHSSFLFLFFIWRNFRKRGFLFILWRKHSYFRCKNLQKFLWVFFFKFNCSICFFRQFWLKN